MPYRILYTFDENGRVSDGCVFVGRISNENENEKNGIENIGSIRFKKLDFLQVVMLL